VWKTFWSDYSPDSKAQDVEWLWGRLNTSTSSIKGIVALNTGRPIGFAHYVLQETTSGPKPECYIEDLYVCLEERGKGTGTEILNWFKEQAKAQGWSKVTLKTRPENVGAQKLYDAECERRSPYIHYVVITLDQ
jgi:GNAT superfamily N-acetyltransferase